MSEEERLKELRARRAAKHCELRELSNRGTLVKHELAAIEDEIESLEQGQLPLGNQKNELAGQNWPEASNSQRRKNDEQN